MLIKYDEKLVKLKIFDRTKIAKIEVILYYFIFYRIIFRYEVSHLPTSIPIIFTPKYFPSPPPPEWMTYTYFNYLSLLEMGKCLTLLHTL